MTEGEIDEAMETTAKSAGEKLQSSRNTLRTLVFSLIGAILYFLLETIPWPSMAIGLIPLGFVPALAVVATMGAIRGPLAGFLTGYLGVLLSDLLLNGEITVFTLYGVAIGILGLITGLASYDFARGRSLAKLSIMSLSGVVFTALLTAVFGLLVERIASIAVIAFQLLPILTMGIPTVVLLAPLFARVWYAVISS